MIPSIIPRHENKENLEQQEESQEEEEETAIIGLLGAFRIDKVLARNASQAMFSEWSFIGYSGSSDCIRCTRPLDSASSG